MRTLMLVAVALIGAPAASAAPRPFEAAADARDADSVFRRTPVPAAVLAPCDSRVLCPGRWLRASNRPADAGDA